MKPAPAPEEVSGLILAGGGGLRAGSGPKAFVELDGRALLRHVLALIEPLCAELVIGLPPGSLDRARALLGEHRFTYVEAGAKRQDTVSILARRATRPYVLLQDVARPLTPAAHFEAALEAVSEHGAVVTAVYPALRDGAALVDGSRYAESLPRERVILTQTPQLYRRGILVEAMRRAEARRWREVSPAALVARAGFPVHVLECRADNLKITYPQDLEAAHLELERRQSR